MTISQQALKNIARLKQKKHRISENKFIVEGARFVLEALQSDWRVDKVLQTHAFKNNPLSNKILHLSQKIKSNHFFVSPADFNKIADTETSQGIAAVIENKNYASSFLNALQTRASYFYIAIEALSDPGNLGTTIRTAAWFGLDAVILGPECVAWHNPKTLRATMGAIFHLPVIEMPDFHKFLLDAKKLQASIYLADQAGDLPYTETGETPKQILLIGHETAGASDACKKLAHHRIVIPQYGKGESLNAAIAAAVIIAQISQKRF
jgi:TrmH family RNA methyltransferase